MPGADGNLGQEGQRLPPGTKAEMTVSSPGLELSNDPGGPTGCAGHLAHTVLLFSAPTCVLCRSSSAPTRSTSPTASSGTRGKSVANPREYL